MTNNTKDLADRSDVDYLRFVRAVDHVALEIADRNDPVEMQDHPRYAAIRAELVEDWGHDGASWVLAAARATRSDWTRQDADDEDDVYWEPPSDAAVRQRAITRLARGLSLRRTVVEEVLRRREEAEIQGEADRLMGLRPAQLPAGGETWDLESGEAPQPEWVVPGLIARRMVHAVTGAKFASKSIWRDAQIVAGLRGQDFLGRPVKGERFMILDGENPEWLVAGRLRALGMTNADWERVHFTGRQRMGQLRSHPAEWETWLRKEISSFRPDVVYIDTVARATPVAVLDNDAVTTLYANLLVPLADEYNLGVVFFHHERKEAGRGATADRSDAALGAMQWSGQADAQITLANVETMSIGQAENGVRASRSRFAMRIPKHRAPVADGVELYEIRGRLGPADDLRELSIAGIDGDPIEELVGACTEEIPKGQLARQAGMNPTGDRFRRAYAEAVASGRLTERKEGRQMIIAPVGER